MGCVSQINIQLAFLDRFSRILYSKSKVNTANAT